MDGHVACMREKKTVCRVLVGKPDGKRPLGRATSRWEYNKRILSVVGWYCEDCVGKIRSV
jgi:hypothetical protein